MMFFFVLHFLTDLLPFHKDEVLSRISGDSSHMRRRQSIGLLWQIEKEIKLLGQRSVSMGTLKRPGPPPGGPGAVLRALRPGAEG